MKALAERWIARSDGVTALVYDDGSVMVARNFGGFVIMSHGDARRLARYLLKTIPEEKK